MKFPMRAAVTLVILALVVPAAPPAWAARGTIRCESRNNNRNFCRVDTENNVSLRRQLSNAPCTRNRTWGFDRNGIWVDRGCRADFEFGRTNSSRNNNNNAAIAAGILGAFAIGAAIGGSQTPNTPPPPVVAPARPPSWAVGHFTAWDPDARSTVILDVVGDGRVFLRNDRGQTVSQGSFRDGSVFWRNGGRSWLAREGPGVMLGDVASGRHFNFRRS